MADPAQARRAPFVSAWRRAHLTINQRAARRAVGRSGHGQSTGWAHAQNWPARWPARGAAGVTGSDAGPDPVRPELVSRYLLARSKLGHGMGPGRPRRRRRDKGAGCVPSSRGVVQKRVRRYLDTDHSIPCQGRGSGTSSAWRPASRSWDATGASPLPTAAPS